MSGQSSVSNGSDDARSSITTNENDNGSNSSSVHPSEPVIQFQNSSTRSSTSPTPSSTNSPPNSSEDNTNYPSPTSIYHQQQTHPYVPGAAEQRRYPFLFTTHQPVYFAESEKLRRLRQKKERKENRKDKNVKETFQTPKSDETYNFEAVLEALGEPKEDKKQKKVKANNVNNGSNVKQKGRRRSNGKNDEKARTEDEDETETAADEGREEGTNDIDATPLLNQRNYVFVTPEPEPGDLRRQTSKSTENLTSFTQVKKRPRWKKKSPSSDDNNVHYYGKSQSFDGKRMNGGGTPEKTFDNQNPDTPSENSSVAGEPIPNSQPPQTQQEEEEGKASDLNFSTDFPPLVDQTESESLSAVWPVKPSSDQAAVINNSSSDSSDIASSCPGTPTPSCAILSGPPDITVQASGVASQSLPDIATQAPLLCNNDSGENTPPLSTMYEKASDKPLIAQPNTAASVYIDDDNVEIVLTEEEYNNRKDSNQGAAVVILGQGELKDWCTSSGLTFGFDINEELMVTTTDTFSQLPNGETITFEGDVSEKFDFTGTFIQTNGGDPKDRNPFILSPESGISSSSPVSWKAAAEAPSPQNPNVTVPRNGEEVWSPGSSPIHWTGVAGPQVQIVQSPDEEWADQEDNTTPTPPEPQPVNNAIKDQDNIVLYDKAPITHNHLEIISVLSTGWKQVKRDVKMKPNEVQYYTPVKA